LPNSPLIFDVAIIGAGWAGLSAAIVCVEAGKKVVLLDAAPQAGGRARHLEVHLSDNLQVDLDNGQHLLIGAYTSCAVMMKKVRAPALLRNRLSLRTEAGIFLQSTVPTTRFALWLDALVPAMPKRGLSFLKAKGFSISDKIAISMALVKLSAGGVTTRWDGYCRVQETVSALLLRLKQPQTLLQNFWNPLCIATMNTLPQYADAATFCRVLRDTFGNPIFEASDFLLPSSHLGASFPEPAIAWLKEHGCDIRLRTSVTGISRANDSDKTLLINDDVQARQLILAMPPSNAHRLLSSLADKEKFEARISSRQRDAINQQLAPLASFDYLPIATVYLAWELSLNEQSRPHPAEQIPTIYMLNDLRNEGRPGQWLFNRGTVANKTSKYALASVVVSAWDSSVSLEELSQQVKQQVASIAELNLPTPDLAKAIIDKKATLACTPDRPRLFGDYLQTSAAHKNNDTPNPLEDIFLAGDYCYPLYPATLEGAVRSGEISANLALKNLQTNH
jgi:hydroxysqualene dehydroxylase